MVNEYQFECSCGTVPVEGKAGCFICDAVEVIKTLRTEGETKDNALNLAWEALRWADGPNEGDPNETWTEIPRDRAIIAFDAVWKAMGEQLPGITVSGTQTK